MTFPFYNVIQYYKMNFMIVAMALMLCSTAVLAIASNTIGIQCLKDEKESKRYQYLISSLVIAIVCIFVSFFGMSNGFKSL